MLRHTSHSSGTPSTDTFRTPGVSFSPQQFEVDRFTHLANQAQAVAAFKAKSSSSNSNAAAAVTGNNAVNTSPSINYTPSPTTSSIGHYPLTPLSPLSPFSTSSSKFPLTHPFDPYALPTSGYDLPQMQVLEKHIAWNVRALEKARKKFIIQFSSLVFLSLSSLLYYLYTLLLETDASELALLSFASCGVGILLYIASGTFVDRIQGKDRYVASINTWLCLFGVQWQPAHDEVADNINSSNNDQTASQSGDNASLHQAHASTKKKGRKRERLVVQSLPRYEELVPLSTGPTSTPLKRRPSRLSSGLSAGTSLSVPTTPVAVATPTAATTTTTTFQPPIIIPSAVEPVSTLPKISPSATLRIVAPSPRAPTSSIEDELPISATPSFASTSPPASETPQDHTLTSGDAHFLHSSIYSPDLPEDFESPDEDSLMSQQQLENDKLLAGLIKLQKQRQRDEDVDLDE